jgi:hypothetical protein
MSLVTKSQPSSVYQKRQGAHHRHNKHYLKAYLPYLPMLAIVAGGGLVNTIWTIGSASASADPSSLSSTRLAAMTGDRSYNFVYFVLGITFLAFIIFVLSHWWRIHRLLNRGEQFAVTHPWIDFCLVIVITAGVVVTRTNG